MRESNGTQLPLVETFGAELERAMANRGGSRWRAQRRWRPQRRVLATACAAGLVAVSLMTAPGKAASGAVGEWLGLAEPGDPPTVEAPRSRGGLATEPTGSVVLASGRAPDGARYEFVYENIAEPGWADPAAEGLQHCLNLEWPDARTGQISPQFGCYPAFPPAVVDEAVVKWQGAMFDPTYTSHVQIAGLARADVSQVRVLYQNEHGAMRDAAVDFARVSSPLRERVGADGPVGVFIAFLPQAWLGYAALYDPRHCPPKEHPYDPDAIEVIAYDDRGEVIARETGNNINSTSGRSPCS
jgi:hypothetical protein